MLKKTALLENNGFHYQRGREQPRQSLLGATGARKRSRQWQVPPLRENPFSFICSAFGHCSFGGGWGTVPQKGVVFVRFQLFPKCLFSVWMIILSYSTHVFSTGTFLFQFMSKLKTFQFFNGQKLPKMRHYFGWLGLGRINDTHLPIPDSHRPILELDHSRSASPKAEDLSRKDLGCILVSGGVLRGQDPLTRNEERRLPYPFALPGIELISPLVFVLFLFLSLFNLTSRLWQDGKSWILSFSPEGKPCWRQLSCF